ncbi:MAG: hypothetical protein H6510_01870 [Acidobacteria bacterium]|nr:hypothetical protein [Acidobacteriota bacterium]
MKVLNEYWLAPGQSLPDYPHHQRNELLMYVHEGLLTFKDQKGLVGTLSIGEFARLGLVKGRRELPFTVLGPIWAHVFEMGFQVELEPTQLQYDQRRFSMAERSGALKLIAANDAPAALGLSSCAWFYSAVLQRGKHIILELSPEQNAWFHLVQGRANVAGHELRTGDGAGLTQERAFSCTAVTCCELLLAVIG